VVAVIWEIPVKRGAWRALKEEKMGHRIHGFWIGILMTVLVGLSTYGMAQQAVDTDADTAAIKRLSHEIQVAFMARDWEKFAAFFTRDAVWMPPDRLPLIGKDAWWSWAQGWWDDSAVEEMEVSIEEIIVAGDWAIERHKDAQVTTWKPSSETAQAFYNSVWILRRQDDDSWRIARYIWNLNPAPDARE
jgi:uncharacterized protein (TIGR02246 family)